MKIIGKTEEGLDIREFDQIIFVDLLTFECVDGIATEAFIGSRRQIDNFMLFKFKLDALVWIENNKPRWSSNTVRTALECCNIAPHFAEVIIKFLKENACKQSSLIANQQA